MCFVIALDVEPKVRPGIHEGCSGMMEDLRTNRLWLVVLALIYADSELKLHAGRQRSTVGTRHLLPQTKADAEYRSGVGILKVLVDVVPRISEHFAQPLLRHRRFRMFLPEESNERRVGRWVDQAPLDATPHVIRGPAAGIGR